MWKSSDEYGHPHNKNKINPAMFGLNPAHYPNESPIALRAHCTPHHTPVPYATSQKNSREQRLRKKRWHPSIARGRGAHTSELSLRTVRLFYVHLKNQKKSQKNHKKIQKKRDFWRIAVRQFRVRWSRHPVCVRRAVKLIRLSCSGSRRH